MPFDIPGHKNSIPVCVEGGRLGVSVVVAEMMLDFVGLRETEPPHVSSRAWREGVGLAVVDAARARVRVMRASIVDSGKGERWQRISKG